VIRGGRGRSFEFECALLFAIVVRVFGVVGLQFACIRDND
jgi:hypothetical protein